MFSYSEDLSSNRYVYFSVTILIGIVVGAATAVLLLTMVACICCAWCPLYKKKTPAKYRGEYLLTIFKRIISILPVILPVSGSQGGSLGYHGIKERKKSGPPRSRSPLGPHMRLSKGLSLESEPPVVNKKRTSAPGTGYQLEYVCM